MEIEQKDQSDNTLANGKINPTKRGRGRPRGTVKKKIMSVKEVTHNARASRRVDFFSPDTVLKPKLKKRGRPKKLKIPGRPRKTPLTPEEEAERMLRFNNRKISKPLGRPRIHPLVDIPKVKRGRGRPRKYEPMTRVSSENSTVNGNLKRSFKRIPEFSEATPRKRGRPLGSFKKKRGRPAGSCPPKSAIEGSPVKRGRSPSSATGVKVNEKANEIPRKRGRPSGSGTKITVKKQIQQETDGTPRKEGQVPGSGSKVKVTEQETDGTPRKRGRPPSSGTKVKFTPQDLDETPRKRGRPPGSAKSKTDVKDTDDGNFSSSALSASDHPRKRGRPSKASLAGAFSGSKDGVDQNEVNDASTPKRARKSFASSDNSNKEAELVADDEKASKNDSGLEATLVEVPPSPAGCREAEKQATIKKNGGGEKPMDEAFEEVFVTGHGSSSRKRASSRVISKSQKRK